MSKADCYKCTYRGTIPGNAHSCCKYPGNNTDMLSLFSNGANIRKLNIRAHQHGIDNHWFYWPINFDPCWLINCDEFKEKE